jgi:hypothetical protein
MALTNSQTLWFQGFWMFFQGQARPSSGSSRQAGWDTAKRLNAESVSVALPGWDN